MNQKARLCDVLEQENEEEKPDKHLEDEQGSTSSQGTSSPSENSKTSSTSSPGCVSNTVEPEEPEIRKDGNTITGTISINIVKLVALQLGDHICCLKYIKGNRLVGNNEGEEIPDAKNDLF